MIRQFLSLSDCDLKFAAAEGSFSGYGSVFGNVDLKNDIIMPGAYADVLASGVPVDVYVNHNWQVGELPVGRWGDLKEDSRGLYGSADLVMKMHSASDAYYAMKAGLVSGLSVAIIPDPKAINRRPDGVREIHRVKALKEISIVTEPANPASQVTNIKFADGTGLSEAIAELMSSVKSAKDIESGLDRLQEAITLHAGHMDGSVPTSAASQQEMMGMMVDAYSLIAGKKPMSMKSMANVVTVRDFERFLRDAGGLSKGAALALVARAKTIFTEGNSAEDVDAKAMRDVEERLARISARLT